MDFYVAKAKFYEKHRGTLNERQEKVIARIFREGIDGFKGGLSVDNYDHTHRKSSQLPGDKRFADPIR